jgi:aldehyde:ferredoxin oxidoreductase
MDQPFRQLNTRQTNECGHCPIACSTVTTFAKKHEQNRTGQANINKRITEFRSRLWRDRPQSRFQWDLGLASTTDFAGLDQF